MKTSVSTMFLLGAMTSMVSGCSDQAGSAYMGQLDQDRNGTLSSREAASDPQLSARFSELDEDGNGQLSGAEFSKFEPEEKPGNPGLEQNKPLTP